MYGVIPHVRSYTTCTELYYIYTLQMYWLEYIIEKRVSNAHMPSNSVYSSVFGASLSEPHTSGSQWTFDLRLSRNQKYTKKTGK